MNKLYYTILIGLFSFVQLSLAQKEVGRENGKSGPFNIRVSVTDDLTGDPVVGASVLIKETSTGDATDVDGNVRLSLNKGLNTLMISYLGYKTKEEAINVVGPGGTRIRLEQDALLVDEIVIQGENADENVRNAEVGKQVMSIDKIESLPQFVGEADILKSITLLPGVSTVGEASSGFNIRGSNSDQNLILLGGSPLYNPSHLFGFFSAFNTDLIQDVSIYKGGIPAKYGGRAASVLDLRYKRGSQEKWGGKASVGLISSKLSAGGPVLTENLTVMLAGRASYGNWVLGSINDPAISNSDANFYDVNAIVDYDISDDLAIRYAFYRSYDDFKLAGDNAFEWSTQNHSISLTKSFGEKFIVGLTAVDGTYSSSIVDRSPFTSFRINSKIHDQSLDLGFKYFLGEGNEIAFGAQTKLIEITPGNLISTNAEFPIDPFSVEKEKAQESGVYLQHDIELGKYIGLSYGVRFNDYRFLGPNSIPQYDPLLPRSEENITEFVPYGDGEVITKYTSVEPRASLRLSINESTSIKAGFNRMFQFIHLISNTTTIAPTDTWKLSDPYIKPQEVKQYSVGLFKNFNDNSLEISVEGFYKDIDDILDYKDGATLILNNNLESELLNGKGEAYGLEFYMEKKKGNPTGWISYTYSRSQRRVIGSYPEETINKGAWYASNFDKPHNFSMVGEYKLGKRVSVSSIFTYSTGRPVTYPAAKFDYLDNVNIPYYDLRNQYRVPAYHRLDLSLKFGFDSPKKWLAGDFVLSVYNLYGRKNAFSVFFDDVPGSPPQAFKLSVLGVPFPSLSYQFEF